MGNGSLAMLHDTTSCLRVLIRRVCTSEPNMPSARSRFRSEQKKQRAHPPARNFSTPIVPPAAPTIVAGSMLTGMVSGVPHGIGAGSGRMAEGGAGYTAGDKPGSFAQVPKRGLRAP
jgi:hypothetical protein